MISRAPHQTKATCGAAQNAGELGQLADAAGMRRASLCARLTLIIRTVEGLQCTGERENTKHGANGTDIAIVRTARKLGHAVVCNEVNGVLNLYALPLSTKAYEEAMG